MATFSSSTSLLGRWGITQTTMWALDRYTSIDARDYASLLHLGGDYVVIEFGRSDGH